MLDAPVLFTVARYPIIGRQRRTRELLRRYLAVKEGERVLDICCGIGEFAGEVAGEYLGIDLNPRFVEAASRRWAGTARKSFRVMDALRMDLSDRQFDHTMWINGLHHFSDGDAVRLLREIARVTRTRVLIIDTDGTPRGLVWRALLAADRGDWMRTPEAQRRLIGSVLPIRHVVPYRVGFYWEVLYDCGVGPSS
jgi:ubiquinone/menaquinone biosynthesis C-methylase UbiE